VLFFERGDTDEDNTQEVWIYDMRTNMRSFGKRTPLKQSDFDDFKQAYAGTGASASSSRHSKREDGGDEGRFRCYTRDEIRERGDNLDITWLHDDDVERVEDLPPPEDIATEIMGNLQMAMDEMESLMAILEGDEEIIVDEPEELPN
jgi:type I restriction enzyme M protein